ncbi:MAG: Gfo/Idh/MocA family oxidoreductase [Chloroflexi bacterium]|nr:Gfo/Idh/MocA family oxidoreductase [Chloroflexota bacterium]
MSALGWGVIGIGSIADRAVVPAITSSRDGRLVGVVSRDQGRADAFAAKHGAPFATTRYEALLAHPEVDVVYIATPNDQHAPQCIAAAGAGKHVFCEKPLALTIPDARTMLRACEAAGVKLGTCFQNRYLTASQQTLELIEEGAIGEVLLMQTEVSGGRAPLRNWRAEANQAGAGTLYGAGPHPLDLLGYLVKSQPTEARALSDATEERWADLTMMVLLRYGNGTLAYCQFNQTVAYPLCNLDVYGTKGRIVGVNTARAFLDGELRVKTEGGERVYPHGGHDAYDRMIDAFNRSILENRPPNPSGLDGLRSLQLAHAILESARDGVMVQPTFN